MGCVPLISALYDFYSNALIHAGLSLVSLGKKCSLSKVYTVTGRSRQWLINPKFFNLMFNLAYSYICTICKGQVAQLLKVTLKCFRRT